MKKFRSAVEKIYHAIRYVPMIVMMAAVFLTVIDVILHLFTNYRILGNMELIELGMVIMVYLCMGTTQLENGHVRVDMFINKLPPKARCAANGCIQCCCAVFCFLLTVQAFRQVQTHLSAGTASSVLHIPYFPFSAVMCIGFAMYTLAIVITAIEYFIELPHAKPVQM